MTADAVKRTLKSQAITLRLQAGSQEAGYLEALFPVPRKPTVVVIQYAYCLLFAQPIAEQQTCKDRDTDFQVEMASSKSISQEVLLRTSFYEG